jgi:bifunctional non-homologous end joining protein LigD
MMARTKDQLVEYRRRRDFRRTAEPAGRAGSRRRRGLQFVVQKHAASHLHYDLRLELDGVMKSWAVPKGPSLDPAVRRLAMQVEDHPLEYNTFEGTIPRDEYGGGTVMLWDRGTYQPDELKPGEQPADAIRRALRAGKLSVTFDGERLHGSFTLVRTDRGPRPKWLLMKHRDDAANPQSDVTAEVLTSVATGRTMEEIAGEADRVWRSDRGDRGDRGGRGGRGDRGGRGGRHGRRGQERATGAEPRADGHSIAPMKPKPASVPPADGADGADAADGADGADGAWTFEAWRGGTRAIAYVTPEATRIVDHAARDITGRHRGVADELSSLAARVRRRFVLDGELAVGDDGVSTFFASDLLLDGETIMLSAPWRERRAALEALRRRRRLHRVQRQEFTTSSATALRRAARQGHAGIIARRADAAYEPGVRSSAMLRIALR